MQVKQVKDMDNTTTIEIEFKYGTITTYHSEYLIATITAQGKGGSIYTEQISHHNACPSSSPARKHPSCHDLTILKA